MSKCPFWSTSREKIECYKECPILIGESGNKNSEQCIFHECTESSNIGFKDIIKEDYSFLNLSIYDDDKKVNMVY